MCASAAKRWASILGLAVVIVGAFFFSGKDSEEKVSEEVPAESAVEKVDESLTSTSSSYLHVRAQEAHVDLRQSQAFSPSVRTSEPKAPQPISHEERASLRTLTSLLNDVTRHPSKPSDLIDQLIRSGYEPVISKDTNDYTGTMVIVRTKNTLPGTRYFHAQYFTDESGKYFPQHLSFEFRPGNSMADIVGQVEATFGLLGKPAFANAEWMEWKLPNEYTLWIKKLGSEDLEGDPFNAYSAADVNTIVVGVEKDIAGHED